MSVPSVPARGFTETEFGIEQVLRRTWLVFSRNIPKVIIVAGLANVQPLLLAWAAPNAPDSVLGQVLLAIGVCVTLVIYVLGQAILSFGAFQVVSGAPMRLAESAERALRCGFPILGIAIGLGLLLTAGEALIRAGSGWLNLQPRTLAPAVNYLLYLICLVVVPPCAVERLGPFRSLGRSSALTKGHRGEISGLLILAFALSWVGDTIFSTVDTAITSISGTADDSVLGQAVWQVWNTIWLALSAILAAVTYHDLRAAKEGIGADQVAAVFD
jgi:hypothetical protein